MADPALEREALSLFEGTFGIPETARVEWINARTEGRPALRQRLLAMHAAELRLTLQTGGAVDALEEEELPQRVGAYRIVGLIGRGGMGAVYRGERDAGDFEHSVAIKVVKPGLLSGALVERFARERQTLAALAHPNIAQLYDGGQTEGESPYIVMELVNGLPLLEWAESAAASKAQRLAVFAQVCAGVGFAHANLVVHRDLTPSNVLVTASGTAKLIDFGIARPADAQGSEGVSRPAGSLASLSLTPGFAAPERHVSSAVTTAADIYSLGKLLEKLLPEERDAEFAAIVGKATATQPEDRYASVDALAGDVAAWERGMPVAAMNGGRGYALRKFVARNLVPVIAAAAAIVLLLGAVVVTTLALNREQAARTEAEGRFGELRSLAGFMIFDLEGELARTVGNIEARRKLVDRAQTYLTALAGTPNAPPDVRAEAGRGLATLAWVQGVAGSPNFGEYDLARDNLLSAARLLDDPAIPAAVRGQELAHALTGLAMIETNRDTDIEAASTTIGRADAALHTVPAGARQERWYFMQGNLRRAQLDIALINQDMAELERLVELLEREIAARPGALKANRDARFDTAAVDYYRSARALTLDELAESVAFANASTARLQQLDAEVPNDPRVLFQLAWSAYIGNAAAQGSAALKSDEVRLLRLARTTIDRLIIIEPLDNSLRSFSANMLSAEAQSAAVAGRFAEAMAMQQEVIDLIESTLGPERAEGPLIRLANAQGTLGQIAIKAGDSVTSCTSQTAALRSVAELERRDALLGYVARIKEPLEANLAICRRGGSTAEMTTLE